GMTWSFYLSGSTENPLSTRHVGNTYVPLDHSLQTHRDAIKEYISGLELPDEQLVYCNLKTEACMAAARRPKVDQDRIGFDDDARHVQVDGCGYKVNDPTAYAVFKAIAQARPYRITLRQIAEQTGLKGKNIFRELNKLPKALQKLVHTTTWGHCLTLPV